MKARIIALAAIAGLLVIPVFTRNLFVLHILIICFVYGVIIANWDLTLGYTGILNFAHFSFFAIGAYAYAILTKFFNVSPWFGLVAGGIITMLSALLVALPTLRLKGIYFCLFSFAFTQILYSMILFNASDLTGGSQGLTHIPALQLGPIEFGGVDKVPNYYLALAMFVGFTIVVYWTLRSRVGLAFQALRDSEQYAVSRGISPYRYKVISVIISGFFTGAIGAFYAQYLQVLSVEMLGWSTLTLGMAMLVVGGPGTLWGPIAASFILTLLSEYLRGLEAYRYIIIGILMVVVIVLVPSGLAGIARFGARISHRRSAE